MPVQRSTRSLAHVVFILAAGCARSSHQDTNFGGTDSATDGSGTDVDSASGGSGERFDIGGSASGGSGGSGGSAESGNLGCKKVDVIFAVDNSSSMQEEMAALRGPVFDSFPAALLDINQGLDDFHLAVIDACNDPPNFHDRGTGGECNYSTGRNYMISSSPDLAGEYACATTFALDGWQGNADGCSGNNDDEAPSNTAADAVSEPAVSDANDGFLRSDAVLFVVAITDEDEQPNPNRSAQEIADLLIAAKGDVKNVVFLGIGGDQACEGMYGTAEEADMLREVAEIFAAAGRGLFWDLCEGDLETGFRTALDVIEDACLDFGPVG